MDVLAFDVRGPIARSDLPGLCDRVCDLFGRTAPEVAFCDVSTVEPDAVTVDALARLQLAARRYGCLVRLRNASAELLDLVSFLGLTDVLPDEPEEEAWPARSSSISRSRTSRDPSSSSTRSGSRSTRASPTRRPPA